MANSNTAQTKKEAPILILNGSLQPYLSLGRHFGGVKAFGHEYIYMPIQDAFLRKDYLKEYNKRKKNGENWEKFTEYVKSIPKN